MGPIAFVVVARWPRADLEAAASQRDKGKACPRKDTPQPSRQRQAVESWPGHHRGVLGQTDPRNGVCVSFLVAGKGLLRNNSFWKEESLAPASPCKCHLWSHFGDK